MYANPGDLTGAPGVECEECEGRVCSTDNLGHFVCELCGYDWHEIPPPDDTDWSKAIMDAQATIDAQMRAIAAQMHALNAQSKTIVPFGPYFTPTIKP